MSSFADKEQKKDTDNPKQLQSEKEAQQAEFSDHRDSSNRVAQLQENADNKTGLPNQLKSGIENMSGIDMSDTKVHYNSSKPGEVGAHAYAQGTDIHVASGQEKHLGHEAWHVVQQKQGKVKPTTKINGQAVNDDPSLEKEADVMGEKALQQKSWTKPMQYKAVQSSSIQRRKSSAAAEKTEDSSKGEEKEGKKHPLSTLRDTLKSTDYKVILKSKEDHPEGKEGMSMSDKLKAAMEEKKAEASSKANRASRVAKDKAKSTAKVIKGLVKKLKEKFSWGEEELEKVEKKNKKTDQPSDKLATAKSALSTTGTVISAIKTISDQLKTHSMVMKAVSEVPGVGAVLSGINLAVGSIEVYETYKEQKEQEVDLYKKYDEKKILYGYKGDDPEGVKEKIKKNMDRTDSPVAKKRYMDKIMSIKDYLLDEELLVIAKKRFKRKVLETTAMFIDFIGRIAELFPGVGTLIGKIMSGVSSAITAGAAAVRGIKQFGRDHGIAGFDASKNSSAKQNKRVQMTTSLLNMVIALPNYTEDTAESYTKVENYYRKAGCDNSELYLHTGHTSEQIDYILESLAKRS